MRVKDVMTQSVECTHPYATLQEVAAKMKALDVGLLPVCDDDRLSGVITDRDITLRSAAEGEAPSSVHVRDIMTPEVTFCFEDAPVSEAAQLMQEKQIRRLVVLDDNKQLVGIVSLGDLATRAHDETLAGNTLEAISEPNWQT